MIFVIVPCIHVEHIGMIREVDHMKYASSIDCFLHRMLYICYDSVSLSVQYQGYGCDVVICIHNLDKVDRTFVRWFWYALVIYCYCFNMSYIYNAKRHALTLYVSSR